MSTNQIYYYKPRVKDSIVPRPRILRRMDSHKKHIRVLSALDGFGKTHTAYLYARQYKTVCWLNGTSPRFLMELFSFTLAMKKRYESSFPSSCVIDDDSMHVPVPFLKPLEYADLKGIADGKNNIPLKVIDSNGVREVHRVKPGSNDLSLLPLLKVRLNPLLVIDDLPALTESEIRKIATILDALICVGCEVVVTMQPKAKKRFGRICEILRIPFSSIDGRALTVLDTDLRDWKRHDTANWFMSEDIRNLRDETLGIPSLFSLQLENVIGSDIQADYMLQTSNIATSMFENIENEELFDLVISMMLLQNGTTLDLERLGFSMKLLNRSELRAFAPLLDIDLANGMFRTITVPPFHLADLCGRQNDVKQLENQQQLPFDENMPSHVGVTTSLKASVVADILFERNDITRAVEVASEFTSATSYIELVGRYGLQLIQTGRIALLRSLYSQIPSTSPEVSAKFLICRALYCLFAESIADAKDHLNTLKFCASTEEEYDCFNALMRLTDILEGKKNKEVSLPGFTKNTISKFLKVTDNSEDLKIVATTIDLISAAFAGKRLSIVKPNIKPNSQETFDLVNLAFDYAKMLDDRSDTPPFICDMAFALLLATSGAYSQSGQILDVILQRDEVENIAYKLSSVLKESLNFILSGSKEYFNLAPEDLLNRSQERLFNKVTHSFTNAVKNIYAIGLSTFGDLCHIFEGIGYLSWDMNKDAQSSFTLARSAATKMKNTLLLNLIDYLDQMSRSNSIDIRVDSSLANKAECFEEKKFFGLNRVIALSNHIAETCDGKSTHDKCERFLKEHGASLSYGMLTANVLLIISSYLKNGAYAEAGEYFMLYKGCLQNDDSIILTKLAMKRLKYEFPVLFSALQTLYFGDVSSLTTRIFEPIINDETLTEENVDKESSNTENENISNDGEFATREIEKNNGQVSKPAKSLFRANSEDAESFENAGQSAGGNINSNEDASVAATFVSNDTALDAYKKPQVYVRMFGTFGVEHDGCLGDMVKWNSRKAKLLLSYILLSEQRGAHRDTLTERLWPDSEENQRKKNFYVSWSHMRKLLERGGERLAWVDRYSGICRIRRDIVFSDVNEFELLAKGLLSKTVQAQPEKTLAICSRLESLYQGDLLAGESDPEILRLRRRYKDMFLDAMICASQISLEFGNVGVALWFARSAYKQNTDREEVYLTLMRAQIAAKQRSSAYTTYFENLRMLHDTFGIQPCSAIQKLYEQLLKEDGKEITQIKDVKKSSKKSV